MLLSVRITFLSETMFCSFLAGFTPHTVGTNSVRMMTNIYSPRPNYSLFDRCDTLSFWRRFVCLTDVIPCHFGEDLFV